MLERTRFIDDYLSGCFTISELASRYGVSRKTLYKWLSRHDALGLEGLIDHSRAPIECPHRTPVAIADEIVAFKRRFPFMGPKKIVCRLRELNPDMEWPAASTAHDILRRQGLVHHQIRPPRSRSPGASAREGRRPE